MIGIDVVDIARLERATRTSRVRARLFSDREVAFCERSGSPAEAFAGTLAAKEAVIKALRMGSLVKNALKVEISRDEAGAPHARVDGGPTVAVSISHASTVAVAVAVVVV